MNAVSRYWRSMTSSFWFVPGAIVAAATLLALVMVEIDAAVLDRDALSGWPRVFGAGAEASRHLLGVVAGSMMTVAGTAFSITLVALSLASSQYSSRVLRNFMRDRANQVVLGVFLGIFAYCLIVLRTIHDRDEAQFMPSLSLLLGLALGFVGIGFLVFFIHHISTSIQASQIIASVRRETLEAIDRLFPRALVDVPDDADEPAAQRRADAARGPEGGAADGGDAGGMAAVTATRSGYLQRVDIAALRSIALQEDCVVRLLPRVGDFILEGQPVIRLQTEGALTDRLCRRIRRCWAVGPQRTLEEDVGFGIRQMVDVALKALSPSLNDSTTAVMCVDNLTAILARLLERDLHFAHCEADGRVRVAVCHPSFAAMLSLAFRQIREQGAGNPAVLDRLHWSLEVLTRRCTNGERRRALASETDALLSTVEAGRKEFAALAATEAALRALRAGLHSGTGA